MSETKTRIETDYSEKRQVVLYQTETLDNVGRLAVVLIEKWALIAAEPDGEDASGRQKMRMATPSELARRAFDIAEETWREARARGHLVALPDLNAINAEYDAKQEAKASKDRERAELKEAASRA